MTGRQTVQYISLPSVLVISTTDWWPFLPIFEQYSLTAINQLTVVESGILLSPYSSSSSSSLSAFCCYSTRRKIILRGQQQGRHARAAHLCYNTYVSGGQI